MRTALLTLMVAGASMLASAASAQPLVSPAWLRAHLSDPSVVVLDLRPTAQHDAGHIPGAVAADYEHSFWRVALPDGSGGALPPVSQIAGTIGHLGVGDASHAVLVSDDFGAAARIYWTFRVLGHQDVSILDGGWRAWTADPQDPVQQGPVATHAASFTAHYDPALRAELPEVEHAVATGNETLVDARPPGQWNGTAKASTVREYGHLPRAVWVDQSRALQPDGQLKPAAELQRIFAPAGEGKTITYCNTGHLAATDWFVLSQVLHRPDVKLYDASMSQWTADPSRPVVRPATEAKTQ